MNGPRLPKNRSALCHTLRAYSDAKCRRRPFDEAHRSWSGDYLRNIPLSSQMQCCDGTTPRTCHYTLGWPGFGSPGAKKRLNGHGRGTVLKGSR
jgi:hypothetical protein